MIANSASNIKNNLPSNVYDCFFFTNNNDTYKNLKNTKWKRVFVPVTVKDNINIDSFDSKFLKACPHLVNELNEYEYTVYIDTGSIIISEDYLLQKIKEKLPHTFMMIPHRWWPTIENAVLLEYEKSMEQERYLNEKNRIVNYINNKINQGYLLTLPMHYETGFIVRKQHDESVILLNETWYEEILKCGIQCQISFFFVQQLCSGTVISLCEPLDPFIITDLNSFNKKITKIKMSNGLIGWIVDES